MADVTDRGHGADVGQPHHVQHHAPGMDPSNMLTYAQDRDRREVGRLYGVLHRQLATAGFVAGDFLSIADLAISPWARNWKWQEQTQGDKPHFARWLDRLAARPAFVKGKAVGADWNKPAKMDKAAQGILFGKR